MGLADNLIMPLLLSATVANTLAHYRALRNLGGHSLGLPFAAAGAAGLGMVALLLTAVAWPDWAARAYVFLSLAVATLAAAVWFWRDKLPLIGSHRG